MVAPFKRKVVMRTRKSYTKSGGWVFCYSYLRDGVNQKLPYVDTGLDLVIKESTGPMGIDSIANPLEDDSILEATNTARARFVGELGDASSFGATLTAELKATWGTVVSGVVTTLAAARAVKRGDLLTAGKLLGFSPPVVSNRIVVKRTKLEDGRYRKKTIRRSFWVMPSGTYVSKSLANKWLWFSYGVKPLVSDIYNGMDVLQRPAPFEKRIRASGKAYRSLTSVPYEGNLQTFTSGVTVRIRATVTVKNPNLWLANQLGLVNPVQMFNEGIPFSFVADWFSNLSQVINQMTDFVGLEIAKPLTISKRTLTAHMHQFGPSINIVDSNKKTVYKRSLEIPEAKLRFAYERFEWQRGANAVSLLVGFLNSVKR